MSHKRMTCYLPEMEVEYLTIEEYNEMPDGTILVNSEGDLVVKGRDAINTRLVAGFMSYGIMKKSPPPPPKPFTHYTEIKYIAQFMGTLREVINPKIEWDFDTAPETLKQKALDQRETNLQKLANELHTLFDDAVELHSRYGDGL